MKKPTAIICLDIGDAKFSAISLSEKGQLVAKAVVSSSGLHKGVITDELSLARELTAVLQKLNEPKVKNIIINLQGKAVRTIDIDISKKYLLKKKSITTKIKRDLNKIKTTLHKDNRLLHYDTTEYRIEHKKITEMRKIVYTDKAYYKKIEQILKQLGYQLKNAYYPLAIIPHTYKKTAIINLGASLTEIAIFNEQSLQEIIQLPLGGESITNDMMELTRLEKDKALGILFNYQDIFSTLKNKDIGHSIHHQIIDSRLKEIFNLIKNSLADKQLVEIIALGGLANLPNLTTYLGDYLKVPTNVFKTNQSHFYVISLQLGLHHQEVTKR